MIGRRQTMCGAMSAIAITKCGKQTLAAESPRTFGCCIPKKKAEEYLANSVDLQGLDPNHVEVKHHSASPALDYAFAQTLAMLCDKFKVLPAFAYYQEGERDDYNANATDVLLLGRKDGTVLYGLNMLGKQLGGPYGATGIIAVAAHEFGHIVAMSRGLNSKLAPDLTRPFQAEQFADFMSGVFAAYRKAEGAGLEAQNVAMALHDLGTNTRESHGTQLERGEAVLAGYQATYKTDAPLNSVVQQGFAFAMART